MPARPTNQLASTRTPAQRRQNRNRRTPADELGNPGTYALLGKPSANFPFPRSMRCNHRYVGLISVNPAIGSVGVYQFSANGLYDPDITGTGHQPMGFDQLCTYYNHYEVVRSVIRATAVNSQEGAGFNFGIKIDDNAALATVSNESAFEFADTNWKTISGPYNTPDCTVLHSFHAKKFFAQKGRGSLDRELWGDAASNPADQAYFTVILGGVTALQDVGAMPVVVTIDYDVVWHEARDFAPS
jgi:hypothetical protein